MRIYTARHGQTSWNNEGRMQGHTDIPLDETGIAQAHKLSERFKDIKISKIYSSDLSRALETARIINKHHNVEIIVETDLREMSFGQFEGRLLSEVGDQLTALRGSGKEVPGGERSDELFARVHSCLEKIIAENDEDILIAGHGGSSKAIVCYFLGLSTEHFNSIGIGNTSVHCFEQSGSDLHFKMIIDNDVSHLEN